MASLTGCNAIDAEVTTLTVIAADYNLTGSDAKSTEKYWAELARAYEAEHPRVRIDVQIEPWSDVEGRVADMVKEGKAPDIAQIGTYADYAAAGKLYSADELLTVPVQANFLPALAEAGEWSGTLYGIPFAASTRSLFYNKKLFSDAGIQRPPTGFKGLAEAVEKLKENNVPYPIALPLAPEDAQYELMMWLLSGGGGYTSEAGRYTIDSTSNIETLDWIKENLVEKELTGPVSPQKLSRSDALAAFIRGEVGLVSAPPSLLRDAEKNGVRVGRVTLEGPDGREAAGVGAADWIMGFKQNGHREEIGDFLNFVFTDENVLDFTGRSDLLPVTVSAGEAMEEDPKRRHLREFLQRIPESRFPPMNKPSWAHASRDIRMSMGEAFTPRTSPASVLVKINRDAVEHEMGSR
ncbi:ABC transporter substrate-binding protein [Streptomyces sp. NPDC059352]|uniref:ABC transporter substrate-binding protein n=1 Tax=Streptomyces sp. NPDC059352 TaxID=3346810 RepID=UPI0036C1A8D9